MKTLQFALHWRHYNLHYMFSVNPLILLSTHYRRERERVLFNQQEPPYLPTSGLNKDTLRKKFPETTWQNTSPIMRMDDQQKLSTYSIGQEIKWKWFHTIQGITLNVNCLSMRRLSWWNMFDKWMNKFTDFIDCMVIFWTKKSVSMEMHERDS